VTPVFKEGNKADCGNYRSISVISVVAKLFEKLVYQQLRSFMTLNNILVEQQSGFRPQHSMETTLLSSTNEWLYNMDRGLLSGVLFLDLKKAFDTVDHHIL
jgi:sarcosine oxidase/L-pipecolate oxidase